MFEHDILGQVICEADRLLDRDLILELWLLEEAIDLSNVGCFFQLDRDLLDN